MEDSFLRTLLEHPDDDATRLVLADWLEEEGQNDRAELVRLQVRLRGVLAGPERDGAEEQLRLLLLAGVAPCVPIESVPLARRRAVSLPLALIPAGSFRMGSPSDEPERCHDEGPMHRVTITRPFYLGVTQVTQVQWRAVMRDNPSTHQGDDRPVDSVSWTDAQLFLEQLSQRTGKVCRLPTEAEWEYACRAYTTTTFYSGNGERALKKVGWSNFARQPPAQRQTHPVARLLPNAFGLFDMHGNVREWCLDGLRTYRAREEVDPRGSEKDDERVVRGGCWYYAAEDARSASRYQRPIHYQLNYYGFRVLVEHG
jgi:uncharacterized protein (TIGR02996 family)